MKQYRNSKLRLGRMLRPSLQDPGRMLRPSLQDPGKMLSSGVVVGVGQVGQAHPAPQERQGAVRPRGAPLMAAIAQSA